MMDYHVNASIAQHHNQDWCRLIVKEYFSAIDMYTGNDQPFG